MEVLLRSKRPHKHGDDIAYYTAKLQMDDSDGVT